MNSRAEAASLDLPSATCTFEISPECDLLASWSERFVEDSSPLDKQEFKTELMAVAKPKGAPTTF